MAPLPFCVDSLLSVARRLCACRQRRGLKLGQEQAEDQHADRNAGKEYRQDADDGQEFDDPRQGTGAGGLHIMGVHGSPLFVAALGR